MAERLTERTSAGQVTARQCGNNCEHQFICKDHDFSECEYMDECIDKLAAYEDLGTVEELAALKERTRWVPVSERLPEKPEKWSFVTYNVLIQSGKVMALDWISVTVRGKEVCRWEWHGRIADWEVTHWMPLPEAPKEADHA